MHAELATYIEGIGNGFAQIFAQVDPLAGYVIVLAIFLNSPIAGAMGLAGAFLGIGVPMLLGFDEAMVRTGTMAFNPAAWHRSSSFGDTKPATVNPHSRIFWKVAASEGAQFQAIRGKKVSAPSTACRLPILSPLHICAGPIAGPAWTSAWKGKTRR